MEIRFKIDAKMLKKGFAFIDADIPTDEQLEELAKDIVLDLGEFDDEDVKQANFAIALMVAGAMADRIEKQKKA